MANLVSATSSRERLIATLNHTQPDRIPIDFGGSSTTGIHVSCVAALRVMGLKSVRYVFMSRFRCWGCWKKICWMQWGSM